MDVSTSPPDAIIGLCGFVVGFSLAVLVGWGRIASANLDRDILRVERDAARELLTVERELRANERQAQAFAAHRRHTRIVVN